MRYFFIFYLSHANFFLKLFLFLYQKLQHCLFSTWLTRKFALGESMLLAVHTEVDLNKSAIFLPYVERKQILYKCVYFGTIFANYTFSLHLPPSHVHTCLACAVAQYAHLNTHIQAVVLYAHKSFIHPYTRSIAHTIAIRLMAVNNNNNKE